MNEEEKADGLGRRQFIRLSGAAGASAVLAGAGGSLLAGADADATHASPAKTHPPGAMPCPTPSDLCGYPSQTGGRYLLWDRAQACESGSPPSYCQGITPTYVVLYGGPANPHNYLLVPSCRVSGIECPFISTSAAPNYWQDAWGEARPRVQFANIGLGINAAIRREQDQLHIHMAGIHSGVQDQLNKYDSKITDNKANWKNQIVPIEGMDKGTPVTRSYRALRVANLSGNLFALLLNNVVSQADMGYQMMVVTPR